MASKSTDKLEVLADVAEAFVNSPAAGKFSSVSLKLTWKSIETANESVIVPEVDLTLTK